MSQPSPYRKGEDDTDYVSEGFPFIPPLPHMIHCVQRGVDPTVLHLILQTLGINHHDSVTN